MSGPPRGRPLASRPERLGAYGGTGGNGGHSRGRRTPARLGRRGRDGSRRPEVPSRRRGPPGRGGAPRRPLPRRRPPAHRWLRRGGRLLRDLGLRHHRAAAAGAPGHRDARRSSASTPGGSAASCRLRPWSSWSPWWPPSSCSASSSGDSAANDGRWAAVFLANFHFAVGRDQLPDGGAVARRPCRTTGPCRSRSSSTSSTRRCSSLVATLGGRMSLRARLSVTLGAVIVASYWLSVVQTASHPTAAYFSPFTRAWELALGALVAVSTTWLEAPAGSAGVRRSPGPGWPPSSTPPSPSRPTPPIPGHWWPFRWSVPPWSSPAGSPSHGGAPSRSSGLAPPSGWAGAPTPSTSGTGRSWSSPPSESARPASRRQQNLILVAIAMVVSMVTYRLVENPIRHWRIPMVDERARRGGPGGGHRPRTVAGHLRRHCAASPNLAFPRPSAQQVVLDQVAAASTLTSVPDSIRRAGYGAAYYCARLQQLLDVLRGHSRK